LEVLFYPFFPLLFEIPHTYVFLAREQRDKLPFSPMISTFSHRCYLLLTVIGYLRYESSIMQIKQLVIICCVFFWSFCSLHAQWSLDVKNILGEKANTRVFLGYESPTQTSKAFTAEVIIRPSATIVEPLTVKVDTLQRPKFQSLTIKKNKQMVGKYRAEPMAMTPVLIQKEVKLTTSRSRIFTLDFTLPPGKGYLIDVDIFNPILDKHTLLTLETPFLVHPEDEVKRSDLLISYVPGLRSAMEQPILSRILKDDTPEIYQALKLQAVGYDAITIRSILYQEKSQGDGGSSQAFQSVYQANKIIYPDTKGRANFQDTLDISKIDPGKYLILILIYSGQGEPKVERVRFVKGRDIQRRIFADLDNSIRMMQYLAPEDRLNELLQKDTIVVKEAEFRRTWDRLYPKDTQEKMEAYYQKVYEANSRYEEAGSAGWQSQRGKIFILYGDPTEEMVEIRGKSYLRWIYPKWSLSFLFEERNQNWVLVE